MFTAACETDPRVCARIGELLDVALDLPAHARSVWLSGLPDEDAQYKERLERLLAQSAEAGRKDFLGTLPKLDSAGARPAPVAEPNYIVGPYRLLRELGAGGMGSVWLAERVDGLLRRPVALKLPHGVWRAGLSERMAYEREIAASLNHPHIARLYDAGLTESGQPYLAFEYVEGQSIDAHCANHRLRIDDRLRLFLQVVSAVSHAHANLVVHRDLKPGNILVGNDGQARLLDFGIAKLLNEDRVRGTDMSQLWGRVLTPQYAAPEQISGEPVTIRSDIYSLGVLLFELTVGQHPYRSAAGSRRALELAILHEDPPRPRQVIGKARRHELGPDLEAIILKAMQKSSGERYATADELGKDIERFLRGKPVTAQKDAAWYRIRKFVGRHRLAASAVLLVSFAMLGATATALWQRETAVAEARRANDIKQVLASVVSGAGPYAADGQARTIEQVLDVVLKEVERVPESQADLRVELLTIAGAALLNQQETDAAEEVLQRALDEGRRRLGEDHRVTIQARVAALPLYRFRGRTDQSRSEIESLLPILRADPKAFAAELVFTLRNQAHLEIDAASPAAAYGAALEASRIAHEYLGPDHPEIVSAELMVALAAQHYTTPRDALEHAHRAMTLARQRYAWPDRHPRVIEAEFVLGRALGGVGRFAEGAQHIQRAVDDSAQIFGASSRKIGSFLVDLARFQLLAGNSAAALESSERAVKIASQHVDPNSARFVAALVMRGKARIAERREREGEDDLRRAADIMKRIGGPAGGPSRVPMTDQRALEFALQARLPIIAKENDGS